MSRVFRATDETSHSRSTRVDRMRRNHSQRGDARDKKIVSATQLHKIRQVRAYVRRIAGIHGSLNHELSSACVIPDEHILVVSLSRVVAVFNPLLVHELELPEKT